MEITADVYAWLTSIDLFDLTTNFSINENGNVLIEKTFSDKIKNGTFFVPLFEKLNEMLNATYGNVYKLDEKLYQLGDSSLIQIRLKNWSFIKELVRNYYGIDITDDEKTLIIAEDNDSFISFFNKLFSVYSSLDERIRDQRNKRSIQEKYEEIQKNNRLPLDMREIAKYNELSDNNLRNESRDSKISRGSKSSQSKQTKPSNQIQKLNNYPDSVDINEINPLKEINHTRSVLEFVILTLCRCFNMKPRQASALLSDGKKYLNHIIIKGLKSNFAPVKTWFTEILVNIEHFLSLIEINSITHPNQISKNIEMSLSCFVSGLLSKNLEVTTLCGRVLTRLAYELTERNLISVAWDWFVMPNGGLEACIYCLNKHNSSVEVVVSLITNFGRFHLYELFNLYLKSLIPNEGAYFAFLADILERLSEIKFFCDEFSKNNIKQYFIDLAVNYSVSLNNNIKLHVNQFLSELWISFSFYIEEEDANNILNVLKKICRDKYFLVAFSGITQMFRLLETFAKQRNKFAPIIFKSITFLVIEYHYSNEIKEFIISNFKHIFNTFINIPVSILIEPLTKQLSTNLNKTYFFNLIDIHFLIKLSNHPKLNIKDAILLLDILGKIYFENINFYKVIRGVFTMILSRYLMNEIGLEFAVKYCKVLTEAYCKLDKNMSEKIYSLALAHNINPEDEDLLLKMDLNIEKDYSSFLIELTKSVILEMLIDILNINNKYLNNVIRSILLVADMRHYNIYSFHNIGLGRVIEYFGNHINIENYYLANKEEIMHDPEFEAAIHNIYDKIPEKKEKKQKGFLPPKGGINKKAEEVIERLKEKKDEIENLRYFKKELVKQKEDLLRDSMKRVNAKRSLELGYNKSPRENLIHSTIERSNKLIAPEGKSLANKYNIILQYNVDILNLTNEEDRDIINLKKVIKDYSRFFKTVFNKYCGSIYHPVNGKLFNSIKQINETISPSEIVKMFKDHSISREVVNKEEVLLIVGLMNVKLYQRKNSKSGLSFDEFIETFIQIANYGFSKNLHNFPNYSISQFTVEMIKMFDRNMERNGVVTLEYKHPIELLTPTEKEVVKSLNLKLMINSMITLPEGFKKYLDTEIKQYHYLPDSMYKVMGRSYKIVIELLDEILFNGFGFHILESFTRVKEVYKARPLFTRNLQEKLELEQQREKLKRLFVKKKQQESNSYNDLEKIKNSLAHSKEMEEKSKRNLHKILKYDKDKFNDTNYEDDEVQMIFDDIEKNSFVGKNNTSYDGKTNSFYEDHYSSVSNKNDKRPIIFNQAKMNKLLDEEKKKIEENEKEKKRKLREQYIKTELEKQKMIKEENLIRKGKLEEIDRAKRNEIQTKKVEQERKLREKIREELEKIKKVKIEEARKKLEIEKKLNRSFSKQKSDLNEVFYNNQVKKLKEQFKSLADERRNNELKKIIQDHQNEIKKEEEKKKLEVFYSEERKVNEKEKKIFTELNKKLEEKSFLMTLDKYGEHINLLYEVYSKSKVNNTLQDENLLFQDEFQMFCVHFNIANLLLDNDQILFIFKKISTKDNKQKAFNFNDFILSIIYLSMFSMKFFKALPKENNNVQTPVNDQMNDKTRSSSLGPATTNKSVSQKGNKEVPSDTKKNLRGVSETNKSAIINNNNTLAKEEKSTTNNITPLRSNLSKPNENVNSQSSLRSGTNNSQSNSKPNPNTGGTNANLTQNNNNSNGSSQNLNSNNATNSQSNLRSSNSSKPNQNTSNNIRPDNSNTNKKDVSKPNTEQKGIDHDQNENKKTLNLSNKKKAEVLDADYTKQIKYYKEVNETNIKQFDNKVLESFFEFLGFELPFNRVELQNYINLQKRISVKDKATQLKKKSLLLLNPDK